jgi:uncharacterized membrane protein
VDYLSLAMSILTNCEPPAACRSDPQGHLRVIVSPVLFDTVLHEAFEPIGHYAASDYSVILSVITAISAIGEQNRNPQHAEALNRFLEFLETVISELDWDANHGKRLQTSLQGVRAIIGG